MAAIATGVTAIWLQSRTPPVPEMPAFSIGIVPLTASSENPSLSAQRESLTRDITTQLARAESTVRIISVPSASSGRPDEISVREVAQRLHVRYLLEGDVRQRNGAIEVGLRLVDGTSGAQAWSETVSLKEGADIR